MTGFIWSMTTACMGWTLIDFGLYHTYVLDRPFYEWLMKKVYP